MSTKCKSIFIVQPKIFLIRFLPFFRHPFGALLQLHYIEHIVFLFHSHEICSCENILQIISEMKALKHLSILCDNPFDRTRNDCPKRNAYAPDEVIEAITQLKCLNELILEHVLEFEVDHFTRIIEALPKLKSLMVKSEHEIKFYDLVQLIEKMPGLQVINVDRSIPKGTVFASIEPLCVIQIQRNDQSELKIEIKTVRTTLLNVLDFRPRIRGRNAVHVQ